MRIFRKLKILIPIIIFLSLGNSLWGAAASNGTVNFGSGWTASNPNLIHTHFNLVGNCTQTNLTGWNIDGTIIYPSMNTNQAVEQDCIVTVTADGTNTASFELTDISFSEFAVSCDWTKVKVVGVRANNSTTIDSENLINSDNTLADTFTKTELGFTPFNGIQFSSFKIYFTTKNQNNNPADFTFNSFTIKNAKTPSSNSTPTFNAGATNTLTVAEDSGATDIKDKLIVTDSDGGDTLTWTQSTAPTHGTISFTSATASAGTSVTSGGDITYTPTADYNGADSFVVQVSDGTATDTITVNVTVTAPAQDSDATLTAGAGVDESSMIPLPSTVNTLGGKVDLFDFNISDGGTSDDFTTDVTQIVINVSGSTDDTVRGQIKWILNGTNVSDKEGTYNSDTITFSSLGISVPKGGSETYKLSAYFNVQSGLTDNATFTFSINGSDDVMVDDTKTKMATGQSAITNGDNAKVDITATKLIFHTEPSNIDSGP